VRGAEDVWNSRDPKRVSLVCTPDTNHTRSFDAGRENVSFKAKSETRPGARDVALKGKK
jgi:nuclear transport factor 2 (NTF2) superfamily protein